MFPINTRWHTRDGYVATVLSIDPEETYPIATNLGSLTWDGTFWHGNRPSPFDLTTPVIPQ